MRDKLNTLLDNLPKVSVGSWVLTATAVVAVRMLLQIVTAPSGGLHVDPLMYVEDYVFMFTILALSIAMWTSHVGKISLSKASTLVLFGLPIIWLGPIIDIIFSLGRGKAMAYILVGAQQAINYWAQFFGPMPADSGVTIGLRVEVFIICLAIGLFAYIRTGKILRSLGAFLGAYTIIYIEAILPSILLTIVTLGSKGAISIALSADSNSLYLLIVAALAKSAPLSNIVGQILPGGRVVDALQILYSVTFNQLFWFISTIVLYIYMRMANPSALKALLGNTRPLRLAHYLLAVLAGVIIATKVYPASLGPTAIDLFPLLTILLTFTCAWIFALIDNDFADQTADRISNPDRPLPKGSIEMATYSHFRTFFLVWTLIGGSLLGYTGLLLVGAYLGLAYIYSNYPLRLKRIPGMAGLCIGLATLSAVLSGYLPWSAGLDLSHFPLSIAIYVTLAITIASTAKDLKDREGDKADGTATLPTILGDGAQSVIFTSIILVVLALSLIYMTWYFILAGIVPAIILGTTIRKSGVIGDKKIFISYLIYLSTLLILFALS